MLQQAMMQSADWGVNDKDYQTMLPALSQQYGQEADSIAWDIAYTVATLAWLQDLLEGKPDPAFKYNGLAHAPDEMMTCGVLNKVLRGESLDSLLLAIQPSLTLYAGLKDLLHRLLTFRHSEGFRERFIPAGKLWYKTTAFRWRLYYFGLINGVDTTRSDDEWKQISIEAQQLFDLEGDGIYHETLRKALNIPLDERIEQLSQALRIIRWLNPMQKTGSLVIVNIPSASLQVYHRDSLLLFSRLVLGERKKQTPSLSSKIHEVLLYPYWWVPASIAKKEILPLIKKNPDYLQQNGFQLLNLSGQPVSPADVNWNQFNKSYFPYILRQNSGPNNSLGLIKFNFNSPYAVYLHDSPQKSLFDKNKRFYSHGCIRVARAAALAQLLLADQWPKADSILSNELPEGKPPVSFLLPEPFPLTIIYQQVWINEFGSVSFYNNIYNKTLTRKEETKGR
jgi:murein L,D-transpeptidase YcbB/YkuD